MGSKFHAAGKKAARAKKVLPVVGANNPFHILSPGDFPVAEKAAREVLSLPIFPELTEAQILRVVAVIKEFFSK